MHIDQQLEIIKRGTVEILIEDELARKLYNSKKNGTSLRIKAGFDPTAPDLHLGHTVVIQKMKQFQDLGHDVIFLIGDFTGMIGDPSGKSEARKALSNKDVLLNAQTYKRQIFKILSPQKTRVVFNSKWMGKMSSIELIKLCAQYTVARILERDDFQKRYNNNQPISIHEFIYPLIQGYDSVALNADIELGGTDQKFNLLVGREIQKAYLQKPQVIITMPIIEGLDGVNKMSKTLNNYIGIDESPQEIFGKIMSISDDLMLTYYKLISNTSIKDLNLLKENLKIGKEHPKEAKKKLAMEIVERFHSKEEAIKAAEEFDLIFKLKKTPQNIEEKTICWEEEKIWLPRLITMCSDVIKSNSESKRLIKQGGVHINKEKVIDENLEIPTNREYILKIGKREFKKVKILKTQP
ncbi:MAG: tyrosine--tRNA ligase [Thermodesulfobacteriota bacterium]|nr:tyrosine--tRNA ligase [Thermodesulfobacteriota bacterium]